MNVAELIAELRKLNDGLIVYSTDDPTGLGEITRVRRIDSRRTGEAWVELLSGGEL